MSQDVMKRELIDIRSDEASSCCLRRGLAPATMMLLFHLTCETIDTRRQTTSPDSRPRINAYLVRPRGRTQNALTHTWPVPELTPVRHRPVTPGAGSFSPSVPRHAVTRPTVVPYLPVDVLAAKGPASTTNYNEVVLGSDEDVVHVPLDVFS